MVNTYAHMLSYVEDILKTYSLNAVLIRSANLKFAIGG